MIVVFRNCTHKSPKKILYSFLSTFLYIYSFFVQYSNKYIKKSIYNIFVRIHTSLYIITVLRHNTLTTYTTTYATIFVRLQI